MTQQKDILTAQFDCRIRVRNHLDDCWLTWFEELSVKKLANGEMLISGNMPDQEALFGLLNKIRDLNLTLIAIRVAVRKTK